MKPLIVSTVALIGANAILCLDTTPWTSYWAGASTGFWLASLLIALFVRLK